MCMYMPMCILHAEPSGYIFTCMAPEDGRVAGRPVELVEVNVLALQPGDALAAGALDDVRLVAVRRRGLALRLPAKHGGVDLRGEVDVLRVVLFCVLLLVMFCALYKDSLATALSAMTFLQALYCFCFLWGGRPQGWRLEKTLCLEVHLRA